MKVSQPVNSNYSKGMCPESGETGEWHENPNRFVCVHTGPGRRSQALTQPSGSLVLKVWAEAGLLEATF